MKTKHTPGNWYVKEGPHEEQCGLFSDVAGRTILATKTEHWPAKYEESLANFKLMAEAPKMYETLKEIREWYEKNHEHYFGTNTPVCFSKALSRILAIENQES